MRRTARRPVLGRVAAVAGVAVLALVAGACASSDESSVDDSLADAVTSGSPTAPGSVDPPVVPDTVAPDPAEPGVQPDGFSTVTLRVTKPDGTVCEPCAWLADTTGERSRGLMEVTDLGDAIGMAFVYEEPSEGSFFMYRTPMPLSIAWFAPDGGFVDEASMTPCLSDESATCERYQPDGRYTVAVEVPEGELAEHGLVPGATVEVLAGTESDRCPSAADG